MACAARIIINGLNPQHRGQYFLISVRKFTIRQIRMEFYNFVRDDMKFDSLDKLIDANSERQG